MNVVVPGPMRVTSVESEVGKAIDRVLKNSSGSHHQVL